MAEKPRIFTQGTVVAERAESCPGWIVMFPNGVVEWFANRPKVEQAARRWFKQHCPRDAIGVGTIEWRDG